MTEEKDEENTKPLVRKEVRIAKKIVRKSPSDLRREKIEKVIDKIDNVPSKTKQRIIYYGIIILTIFGLYYFMSPYRNCLRETDEMISDNYPYLKGKDLREKRQESKLFCISRTSW